ncbi:hypothetical protein B6259_05155 [Ruminococcaceae bacterium CPB6]|jgi:N-acetylmuramoyl-L-alanine amidase|uniref:N-acetylmuramoyl-L-alanine amidase n=2 Tax=Oscillospiraceae TaxID=216572 RepID=A0A859DQS4_9FIRM|nr:hypothetical protein B6259_05155 [Ruminococcaceae bacterium CPB6]QKN23964.1 N-acetylmuramoyl-L-alanine amidase [Caproicibacterium lactatifermentans]QKO30964.1 N-acetylmuramoyl-L-alanine amidase [Caproicibacterium lactatifermentans]
MKMKVKHINIWMLAAFITVCVLFLFLLSVSCFHTAQTAVAAAAVRPLVVLDAGHGGEDGGAVGCSPVPEKVLNLSITKKIEKGLTSAGCRVVMTRTDDTMLGDNTLSTLHERKVSDIHKRLSILQENPGGIFVSIHQNHFADGYYNGAQVFYSSNHPKSKILAESIRQSIVSSVQPQNKRENKAATSSIYLLAHAKDPAILIECGFLSNASEAKLLNDTAYQQKMADAVTHGILNYQKQGAAVSSAVSSNRLYSSVSSAIIK